MLMAKFALFFFPNLRLPGWLIAAGKQKPESALGLNTYIFLHSPLLFHYILISVLILECENVEFTPQFPLIIIF